jgi:glycosyltransferase involved in cell wall biosynthesis
MIRALSLPFDDRKQRFRIPPRESLVPPGRLLAVTVGDVNPNKRIRQWLQVLRQNRHLSDRLLYVVVGDSQSDHGAELAQLSVEYGLGDMVRFTGYATEEQLAAWLTHADFCVNLRFPNTEAASGSAIEQLAYGKPLIVSDTGFYSELPNDCVLKVRVDREADDLAAAAERLVSNAQLRQAMSARARTYARETFRADRYAEGIQDFAAGVLDAKPLLAFADRVAVEIGRMGGNSSESLVSTVAAISSRLFGK